MTDNFDEFEQDQFDETEINEGLAPVDKKNNLKDLFNKPVVKLLVIVGFVGVAIAGSLGAFSDSKAVESSRMVSPPDIKEVPGGDVTPFFAEQNKMAHQQRVKEALETAGSAMPTPQGKTVDSIDIDALTRKNAEEEFTARTERLRREWRTEQQRNEQRIQQLQQQIQQKQFDDSLAQAMQKQMSTLMASWAPQGMKVVAGVEAPTVKESSHFVKESAGTNPALVAQKQVDKEEKLLVRAGTVNYAQLLVEANSDVPGPIMVQILSGPLAGARAIGQFQVMYEQLVLTFNVAVLNNKEYQINAIALDPETTLGGLATEVDHRYLKRVLLPAAAGFVSNFGEALSSAGSETVATGSTVVIQEVKKGYKEAMFEGMAGAGETVAKFLEDEASRTKTLVRVEVGTPVGLFFLKSVMDQTQPSSLTDESQTNLSEAMAKAYVNHGYGAAPPPNFSSTMTAAPAGPATVNNYTKGVKTPGGTTTIYTGY